MSSLKEDLFLIFMGVGLGIVFYAMAQEVFVGRSCVNRGGSYINGQCLKIEQIK